MDDGTKWEPSSEPVPVDDCELTSVDQSGTDAGRLATAHADHQRAKRLLREAEQAVQETVLGLKEAEERMANRAPGVYATGRERIVVVVLQEGEPTSKTVEVAEVQLS